MPRPQRQPWMRSCRTGHPMTDESPNANDAVPPPPGTEESALPIPAEEVERIKGSVLAVLKHTFDPEIPVNIYDLGLIYGVDVATDGRVDVKMTLTSPMCPVAGSLPPE